MYELQWKHIHSAFCWLQKSTMFRSAISAELQFIPSKTMRFQELLRQLKYFRTYLYHQGPLEPSQYQ